MRTDEKLLNRYWTSLDAALPRFDVDERSIAVALYRELARGGPVSPEQLAGAVDAPVDRVERILASQSVSALIYRDEDENILGFGGLAAVPMAHRLELEGRTLWTWCAWDSVFIPEILGQPAEVVSRDPETDAELRLKVDETGVRSLNGEGIHVSFVDVNGARFDSSAENVMGSFCHFVFFFESRESGERWVESRDGTFLVTLADAWDLAKRLNERTWGDALHRPTVGSSR